MADSLLSSFNQTIGRFFYDPQTNWSRFFNPQMIFNFNPEDAPVEAHVLSKVGSYGSQLSTLIDALDVVQARIERKELDPCALAELEAFDKLRDRSQNAVDEFREKIGADEIVRATKDLIKREPSAASGLRARLDEALSAAPDDATKPKPPAGMTRRT